MDQPLPSQCRGLQSDVLMACRLPRHYPDGPTSNWSYPASQGICQQPRLALSAERRRKLLNAGFGGVQSLRQESYSYLDSHSHRSWSTRIGLKLLDLPIQIEVSRIAVFTSMPVRACRPRTRIFLHANRRLSCMSRVEHSRCMTAQKLRFVRILF